MQAAVMRFRPDAEFTKHKPTPQCGTETGIRSSKQRNLMHIAVIKILLGIILIRLRYMSKVMSTNTRSVAPNNVSVD